MPPKIVTASIFYFTIIISAISCTKEKFPHERTINDLYKFYKNGEITECKYNENTVFCAGENAYDAGSTIYDISGKPIGKCDFAWNQVDKICKEVKDCEVIYRCENHISGEPAVNKYGLGK